jgi:hypothetical protein
LKTDKLSLSGSENKSEKQSIQRNKRSTKIVKKEMKRRREKGGREGWWWWWWWWWWGRGEITT